MRIAILSALAALAASPALAEGRIDQQTMDADHIRALRDHDALMGLPPSNRDIVISGGGTLWQGRDRKRGQPTGQSYPTLAEQLDGCLYPSLELAPPPKAGTTRGGVLSPVRSQFDCVAMTSRAAARHYRLLSGRRSWEAESFTAASAFGFTGLAVSAGHNAQDTISTWTAAGLIPAVMDDIASPGPRARLYNVGATAMTVVAARAETLVAAAKAMTGLTPPVAAEAPGGPLLQSRVEAACSQEGLDALDGIKLPDDKDAKAHAAKVKAQIALSSKVKTRCDELIAAAKKLTSAALVWDVASLGAARGLALDTTNLDDTITRLDRMTEAPSRSALSVVLSAFLSLPAKLTAGTAPPEYVGRNLPVFTSTYTFNLARAPDAELPGVVAADLSTPDGLEGDKNERVEKIARFNRLSAEINQATTVAAYFKAVNDRSILSVSPGGDQPVTLNAPPKN